MRRLNLGARLRLGLVVLIALAVLTALEIGVFLAIQRGALPYLSVLALLKAGLIAHYFMHLTQLWREEE